jgi:poly(A) polymerase
VGQAAVTRLDHLVSVENEARLAPDPLRRLAALIPRDEQTAERIAARLKLSNKARKRLACAAAGCAPGDPRELAYRVGTECAVDRLLLDSRPADAAETERWPVPRLPLGGGDLIARGVPQGPQVAAALRRVEDAWIAAGFPTGEALEGIVAKALA